MVANRDRLSALAAVNMLYGVGARNEAPERTGFAHLFEHLMFRGTKLVPDFDMPVQVACGENNAFTNNDYTDYYMTLPKDNIETALWLESDRMTGLDITPEKLAAEKSVVVEEYKQRYLNQPYGEQWLLLRALAYKVHPYRWPTIGLTPDHIREATLADVTAFYRRYYVPRMPFSPCREISSRNGCSSSPTNGSAIWRAFPLPRMPFRRNPCSGRPAGRRPAVTYRPRR